jgi:hypothetical protein
VTATPRASERTMSAGLAAPLTGGRGELRLARDAGFALLALAVPVLTVAGVLQGIAGIVGAAAGLGLVAVLFVAAGVAQGLAARRSSSTVLAVAIGGFGIRLAVYLAVLQALGQVSVLHRPSLALATAFGFVVTLYYEMRVISRTPELFWVDAARATDPRSAQSRAGR